MQAADRVLTAYLVAYMFNQLPTSATCTRGMLLLTVNMRPDLLPLLPLYSRHRGTVITPRGVVAIAHARYFKKQVKFTGPATLLQPLNAYPDRLKYNAA